MEQSFNLYIYCFNIRNLRPQLDSNRSCKCGDRVKIARATTKENRGRLYMGCPNFPDKKSCDFFEWQEIKHSNKN